MPAVSIDPPLTLWYCDECRQPITDVYSGTVSWEDPTLSDSAPGGTAVHRPRALPARRQHPLCHAAGHRRLLSAQREPSPRVRCGLVHHPDELATVLAVEAIAVWTRRALR